MRPPIRLADDELREYAKRHLSYEIHMLRWSASVLYALTMGPLRGRRFEYPVAQATANIHLEAFTIHCRNLVDFLYLRNHYHRDRPSDVVVEDFLPEGQVAPALPAITELLADAKVKVDKQVAHLASGRLTFGVFDRNWMFTQIHSDVVGAMRQVIPAMPASRVPVELVEAVSRERAPLDALEVEPVVDESSFEVGISLRSATFGRQ